jgi:hypothetical protein
MPLYEKTAALRRKLKEKCASFGRFNAWERQTIEKPDVSKCLAAVFELYEMIPDKAKKRPVNIDGIIKMREGLACLK